MTVPNSTGVDDGPLPTYFDASDVAKIIGVSKRRMNRLFCNGTLPGHRKGSSWRTNSQGLNAFLLHNANSPKLEMLRKQVRLELKLA